MGRSVYLSAAQRSISRACFRSLSLLIFDDDDEEEEEVADNADELDDDDDEPAVAVLFELMMDTMIGGSSALAPMRALVNLST